MHRDEALRPEILRVFEGELAGLRRPEDLAAAWPLGLRCRAPVHHSDCGSQYLSIRYTERLAEAGIGPLVGSVGDSYHKALAEKINGLFKAEVIHRRGPRRSFETVEYETLEWVDWFNNCRLLETARNIAPAEAEANFYATWETESMAAYLTEISLRQTRGGSSQRPAELRAANRFANGSDNRRQCSCRPGR